MSDESWHLARRLGVGGSDVGAILGLSSWRTPLEVFLEKRGELAPNAENSVTRWGKLLEPVVRQEYAERTGRTVVVPTEPVVHPRHPFMRANLDGYTLCGRIYEGKTARAGDDWGEEGTDEVPQPYLFQVQHEMCITGYEVADLTVLVGWNDMRIYTVEADRELHEMLIEAEAEFWRRVQENDPPEPTTISDALHLWGRRGKSKKVVADEATFQAILAMREVRFEIQKLRDREEDLKLEVMGVLRDADTLVDGRGNRLATWRHTRTDPPVRQFKLR